jgi:hypothetical protein
LIIVQLRGGLGNQLFQYAAALSLALHHNVPVKVDVNELKVPDEKIGTFRKYELQNIVQPPVIATEEEILGVVGQPLFKKYYQKLLPPYKREIYKEASFRFDEHFFEAGKNIYLKGYRQSEKHFQSIAPIVRSQLFIAENKYEHLSNMGIEVRNQNSVSIHIRRGDYVKKVVQEHHGLLDETYYQQAIDKITLAVENPLFYVFSDEPGWVKEHLKFQQPVTYVSHEITKNHYEDFYLMSCCRHNIVANSSFSWWAAWFNNNPDKKVIAPLKWFNKAPYDTTDLVPDSWIRI